MDSIIFISNRLPVTVIKDEEGIRYKESIGGLSTGLKSYHEAADAEFDGSIKEERISMIRTAQK